MGWGGGSASRVLPRMQCPVQNLEIPDKTPRNSGEGAQICNCRVSHTGWLVTMQYS